jgi:uncharacterized protein (TIGR02118 family)
VPIKIVVLYPQPTDSPMFERVYHHEHLPLMRRLITPADRVPTYRVRDASAPFYRMAEIHFPNLAALEAFGGSRDARVARQSSEQVSTGGKPVVLVCDADPPV